MIMLLGYYKVWKQNMEKGRLESCLYNRVWKSKFSWLALLFKHFFIKIKICVSKKRSNRESVSCLMSKKISGIIAVSLLPQSSPDLNPFDYALWGVLDNVTNATSHQVLVHLRLFLRSNGIKCLENLFWRHANHFEGVLIQLLKKWQPYWVNLLFCIIFLILLFIFKNWINLVLSFSHLLLY